MIRDKVSSMDSKVTELSNKIEKDATSKECDLAEPNEKAKDIEKLQDETKNNMTKIEIIEERIKSLDEEHVILKQKVVECGEWKSTVDLDEAILRNKSINRE